jgi:hypothetical protein
MGIFAQYIIKNLPNTMLNAPEGKTLALTFIPAAAGRRTPDKEKTTRPSSARVRNRLG